MTCRLTPEQQRSLGDRDSDASRSIIDLACAAPGGGLRTVVLDPISSISSSSSVPIVPGVSAHLLAHDVLTRRIAVARSRSEQLEAAVRSAAAALNALPNLRTITGDGYGGCGGSSALNRRRLGAANR